ncbi:DUF551 domain-containing protein [Salmonella enterica]|uniref:DUF551 domain-containing protein n=1 Tax=Salmonella enterica TaxID=28901 RepID=UPI0015E8116C
MTTNNHLANGPVSLDRLHQISEILSKAAAQSDGGNLGYAMADAVKVIDGAIAAMNANPVAWRYRYVHTPKTEEHGSPFTTEWKLCDSEDECNPSDCFERQPLYTAPPAPVVPAEIEPDYEVIKAILPTANPDEYACCIAADMWNACRAAMLQAEPVSNRDELPLDYLQGQKDGLEWAAQLAEANHPQTGDWLYDDPIELARAIRKGPDMPEFKSVSVDEDDNFYSWFGRFWYENYQKNNYTTSAKQMLGTMAEFAYRAGRESAALAGNSPVTPEGWIPVSERMPEAHEPIYIFHPDYGVDEGVWYDNQEGAFLWDSDYSRCRAIETVSHWMPMPALPAAPQQEVKSALEHGMQRYAGAMQKLSEGDK